MVAVVAGREAYLYPRPKARQHSHVKAAQACFSADDFIPIPRVASWPTFEYVPDYPIV